MDEIAGLARMFRALGDPTRLRIFGFLQNRCCGDLAFGDEGDIHPVDGPSVGEVCCHVTGLERINSTISFHIKELKESGLIRVEKRGKYMICSVNRDAAHQMSAFLMSQTNGGNGCHGDGNVN